jgi:hypothetical protein
MGPTITSKPSLLLWPALLLDTRALLERLDLALGSGARPRLTHAKSLTATWKSQGSQVSGRFLGETARKARRIDHISANLCLLLHEEGNACHRGGDDHRRGNVDCADHGLCIAVAVALLPALSADWPSVPLSSPGSPVAAMSFTKATMRPTHTAAATDIGRASVCTTAMATSSGGASRTSSAVNLRVTALGA